MEVLKFEDRKVEKKRTHSIEGKVIFAEDYKTDKGSIPGVRLQLDSCPYKLNVLTNSIKGAGNAATISGCKVRVEGDLRDYEGRQYLNPRDVFVTEQSTGAKLAANGISYSGAL